MENVEQRLFERDDVKVNPEKEGKGGGKRPHGWGLTLQRHHKEKRGDQLPFQKC